MVAMCAKALLQRASLDRCSAVQLSAAFDIVPAALLLCVLARRNPRVWAAFRLDKSAVLAGFGLLFADLWISSMLLRQPISWNSAIEWAGLVVLHPVSATAVFVCSAAAACAEEVSRVYIIEAWPSRRMIGAALALALSLLMHSYYPFAQWYVVATSMTMYIVAYLVVGRGFMLIGAHLAYDVLTGLGPCVYEARPSP